jgi:hypothetical protein
MEAMGRAESRARKRRAGPLDPDAGQEAAQSRGRRKVRPPIKGIRAKNRVSRVGNQVHRPRGKSAGRMTGAQLLPSVAGDGVAGAPGRQFPAQGRKREDVRKNREQGGRSATDARSIPLTPGALYLSGLLRTLGGHIPGRDDAWAGGPIHGNRSPQCISDDVSWLARIDVRPSGGYTLGNMSPARPGPRQPDGGSSR